MKIGIISDTHGFLDPEVLRLFQGVDHILHGGDIGSSRVIALLEDIAPVTAVSGNTDAEIGFRETEIIRLMGRKFLLHHIVDVRSTAEAIKRRIDAERPDVIVFGHTHRRHCEYTGPTLYLNPGYAGKPRFNLVRSVAILSFTNNRFAPEFFDLE